MSKVNQEQMVQMYFNGNKIVKKISFGKYCLLETFSHFIKFPIIYSIGTFILICATYYYFKSFYYSIISFFYSTFIFLVPSKLYKKPELVSFLSFCEFLKMFYNFILSFYAKSKN